MNAEPDIEVVGEGASAEEAYGLIPLLVPDVVLMDVQLPGDDGIAATERITFGPAEHGPKVIVLTTFELDDYAFRSLQAGASGFLLKRARGRGSHRRRPDRRERQRAPRPRSHSDPGRTVRRIVARARVGRADADRSSSARSWF